MKFCLFIYRARFVNLSVNLIANSCEVISTSNEGKSENFNQDVARVLSVFTEEGLLSMLNIENIASSTLPHLVIDPTGIASYCQTLTIKPFGLMGFSLYPPTMCSQYRTNSLQKMSWLSQPRLWRHVWWSWGIRDHMFLYFLIARLNVLSNKQTYFIAL